MRTGPLSNHILLVSSTMVGVCMTMLSIIQLAPKQGISRWVDDLLAFDSMMFLASTLLSYWALRHEEVAQQYEKYADFIFLIGMICLVATGFDLVSFELLKN